MMDFKTGIFLGIVCILTIGLIVLADWADKPYRYKKDVGRQICENNSLEFIDVHSLSLTQDEVRCQLNQTLVKEHYNLTADPIIVHAKVDWSYYK